MRFASFDEPLILCSLQELFNISAAGDIEKGKVSNIKTDIFCYPIIGNALTNSGLYGYTDSWKQNNSITVTGRGEIGIAFERPYKYYPIVRLLTLKPKGKSDLKYFECLINSRRILNESTGVPQLTTPQIGKQKYYIVAYEEQRVIGDLFRKIDERIETQNKIIEKYESLIKQLNDDIFSRGDNSKISDFIQELSKRNKDGAVTNVLSVSNKNGFVKQSEQFEDKELASEDKTNYKIVQKGDFAFNPARINVGSIALLKNQEIGIVSPMYICFKAKNIPSEILESYFSSSSFKKEMNKRLEGSVRMCLTIDGMKNIRFHNPSKKEIDILSRLTKLKELVVISKRILDLYNSQKSYLLSNLFI